MPLLGFFVVVVAVTGSVRNCVVTMPKEKKKSLTFLWQFVLHNETLQRAAVTTELSAGSSEL